MKLTNRDAMAYVLWRWADENGRPIHVSQAETLVDEMLAMCPAVMQLRAQREWRSMRRRAPALAKPSQESTA